MGNPFPGRRFRRGAGGLGTHFFHNVGVRGVASGLHRIAAESPSSPGQRPSLFPVLGGVLLLHVRQRPSGRLGVRLGLLRRATHDTKFIAFIDVNGIFIPRPSGHDTEFSSFLRCSSAASGRLGVCLGLQRRASLDKEFIAFIGVNGIFIFGTRSSYFRVSFFTVSCGPRTESAWFTCRRSSRRRHHRSS